MTVGLRWARLVLSFCFFCICVICAGHYPTSIYLLSQAKGQLAILQNTCSFDEFRRLSSLSAKERENLLLVEKIKTYSVDSLSYSPTHNFTRVYDQKKLPVLWVITACDPYAFKEYTWAFPIVGKVSYKGFFKKELAQKEYNHLVSLGYDVDLRSVSAWSTLGWFKDPLLSSMLNHSKAGLCNLLFHELFHATYYVPNSVDLDENLANFIAGKATQKFLKNDPGELNRYADNNSDEALFSQYMLNKKNFLDDYYKRIYHKRDRLALKLRVLMEIADSVSFLPLHHKEKYVQRANAILAFKNAYFIDFQQYDSMQDSLENVFNKIYKGDIKKLVQDLTANEINY